VHHFEKKRKLLRKKGQQKTLLGGFKKRGGEVDMKKKGGGVVYGVRSTLLLQGAGPSRDSGQMRKRGGMHGSGKRKGKKGNVPGKERGPA